MKKTYVKPELYFENFELSTNIATGCEYKTNHAKDVCAYKMAGDTLFLDTMNICEVPIKDGDNSLCYHVPNDKNNIFTS